LYDSISIIGFYYPKGYNTISTIFYIHGYLLETKVARSNVVLYPLIVLHS